MEAANLIRSSQLGVKPFGLVPAEIVIETWRKLTEWQWSHQCPIQKMVTYGHSLPVGFAGSSWQPPDFSLTLAQVFDLDQIANIIANPGMVRVINISRIIWKMNHQPVRGSTASAGGVPGDFSGQQWKLLNDNDIGYDPTEIVLVVSYSPGRSIS